MLPRPFNRVIRNIRFLHARPYACCHRNNPTNRIVRNNETAPTEIRGGAEIPPENPLPKVQMTPSSPRFPPIGATEKLFSDRVARGFPSQGGSRGGQGAKHHTLPHPRHALSRQPCCQCGFPGVCNWSEIPIAAPRFGPRPFSCTPAQWRLLQETPCEMQGPPRTHAS